MYLNNYSVRITNGNEVEGGYVEMEHAAQYSIVMRNEHSTRCDATVVIDGKEIGSFRLDSFQTMTLERKPGDERGKFTFFKEGTSEAQQAQAASGNPNNGLVSVTFVPEREIKSISNVNLGAATYRSFSAASGLPTPDFAQSRTASLSGRRAGGTGLTGHSNQDFVNVNSLDYDYSKKTTINLRLVAQDDSIRPLVGGMSNPIPPYNQ